MLGVTINTSTHFFCLQGPTHVSHSWVVGTLCSGQLTLPASHSPQRPPLCCCSKQTTPFWGARPRRMQDPSSPTRDGAHAACRGSRVLTSGRSQEVPASHLFFQRSGCPKMPALLGKRTMAGIHLVTSVPGWKNFFCSGGSGR